MNTLKTELLLLCSLAFCAAAQTSLTASLPTSVYPGPTYTASLSLVCPSANCAAVQWSMSLANGITIPGPVAAIVTATAGPVAIVAQKTVSCADFPGILNCLVAGQGSGSQTLMVSGVMAQWNFNVMPGTPPGPVTLTFSNIVAADAAGNSVPITGPGPITVNVVTAPCDLNGDGKLDSSDFMLLISRVLGVAVPAPTGACDINSDQKCNVQDLQILGQSILTNSCVVQ